MQSVLSILPVDERTKYMADYLARKGGRLCSSQKDIASGGYVICGTPFSKDGISVNCRFSPALSIHDLLAGLNDSHTLIGGNLPASVTNYCDSHGIAYYDVLASPDLAQKNARLTAEGLLISLLSETHFSICGFKTLLCGYGICGKEIAAILRLFTDEIYIYDISTAATELAKADGFQVVSEIPDGINTLINTAPANPFSEAQWNLPAECVVFNIASTTLTCPLPVISCPGIPGKYAPKTAGILIAKQIIREFHL